MPLIDLTKVNLPETIEVAGRLYPIKTDFRFWLTFQKLWHETKEHTYLDFDFLYDGDIPSDRAEGYKELVLFFTKTNELPRDIGARSSHEQILDYLTDSDYIYAAFLEQYKIDLTAPELKLHWWKFKALVNGLHNTKLNEIIGYRCYEENTKVDQNTEKRRYRQLKEMWRIKEEVTLTEEEQRLLDRFNAIGGK